MIARRVEIVPMRPVDAVLIKRQPSQLVQLGLTDCMDERGAADAIARGEAWTMWRDQVPIACMGILETFPGVQGVAWAILSEGIGFAHLGMTRHAQRQIAMSKLVRVEALVRASSAAECAWAKAVGLEPEALLHKFGALSEDHVVYTRIR